MKIIIRKKRIKAIKIKIEPEIPSESIPYPSAIETESDIHITADTGCKLWRIYSIIGRKIR